MDFTSIIGVKWSLLFVCYTVSFSTIIHSEGVITRRESKNKFTYAKQELTNCYHKGKRHVSVNISIIFTRSLDSLCLRDHVPKNTGGMNGIMWTNNTLLFVGLDLWAVKIPTLPPDYSKGIRFVKVIQWKERLYLLACYDRKCNLFLAYRGSYFSYRHTISDIPGVPIAAQLFSQGNSLFLIVLFRAKHSALSQATLYQWQNTYMDRQHIPEITTRASDAIVFNHNNSSIFILYSTNNGDNGIKFASQVWIKEVNEDVRRVQYLPSWKLRSLTHFVDRGENFLLLLEDNKASIYWWKGDEFVLWISEKMLTYSSISVSGTASIPTLLVFSRNNILEIYIMSSESLEKVFENTFIEMISISSTAIFNEGENIYIMIHYESQNAMYIQIYQLSVSQKAILGEPELAVDQRVKQQAQETLGIILDGITALDGQLSLLDSILHVLLFTDKELTLGPTATTYAMEVHNGDVHNLSINELDISSTIQDLHSKILPLAEEVNTFSHTLKYNQSDHTQQLVIEGDVHIQQARINYLVSEIVNDGRFVPTAFLRVKNNYSVQRLSNVKAKVLRTNWLALTLIGSKTVKDLLLNHRKINVPVYSSIFQSGNLQIDNELMINNITVKDLMDKNVTKVAEEDVPDLNLQDSFSNEEKKGTIWIQLQDFTLIENLIVETINSLPVNDLLKSLFLRHERNRINGNLHFKKGARIEKLKSKNEVHAYSDDNKLYEDLFDAGGFPWTADNTNQVTRWRRSKYSQRTKKPSRAINAKVKIIGNLRVSHLTFQNSFLQTNSYIVPTSNIGSLFWTYTSPQIFNNQVNFTQGILLTRGSEHLTINGINVSHYATRNSIFNHIIIENVHIDGDVFLQEGQKKSNEKRMQDFYELEVKHLKSETMNGRKLKNIVHFVHRAIDELKMSASKVSVGRDLNVGLINDIDLRKQFQKTVLIDEPAHLPQIVFKAVSAKLAQVELLNDLLVDFLLDSASTQGKSSLYIKGNIHISKLSDVIYVNNKTANLSLVVNKSNKNMISGKKEFSGQIVCTGHITITSIKRINAEHVFTSLLKTSADQLITGFYSIKEANIGSLTSVKDINATDISRLIYTDQTNMRIIRDIDFKSILVKGNITVSRLLDDCSLPKVGRSMVFGSRGKWDSLRVDADCSWKPKVTDEGLLQQLLSSAVTVDSHQTIVGNINITHLFSKTLQVHSLNNRNATFLFLDFLYRNKKDQVLWGKKTFFGSVKCQSMKVKGDARFTYVNNVNVNDIDEKLVRHKVGDYDPSTPVFGHKTFMHGFKAFLLTCTEGINKIPYHKIAQEREDMLLPPLIIQSIVVSQNIQCESINDLIVDKLYEDSIYSNAATIQVISHGVHIKGAVCVQGNVTTPAINTISSWDLMYTTGKYQKAIKGCQTFLSNVKIEANASVETLNDNNLFQKYEYNLKVHKNATINGSLVVLPGVELETVYAKKYVVHRKPLLKLKKSIAP